MQGAAPMPNPRAPERLWTLKFLLVTGGNGLFFSTLFFLMPILPMFIVGLGGSESQVGLTTSVSAAAAIVARMLGGAGIDRYGTRVFLMGGGALNLVAALLLIGSQSLALVLVSRALQGAALGLFTTSASVLVAGIVPASRRAEGLGWFGLSGNMAMAIGPVISGFIAVSLGFTGVFAAAAGLSACAILIAFALRDSADGGSGAVRVARPDYRWLALRARTLLPSASILSVAFGVGGVMTFIPIRGHELGLAGVGFFFTGMALSQMLARVLMGRAADRFGRFAVIVPAILATAAGLGLLAFTPSVAGLVWVSILVGVGWGALMPAILALTIDRVPAEERGAAMGTLFAALDLGVALGAGLLGLLIQHGSFSSAFVLAAVVALCGGLLSYVDWARGSRRMDMLGNRL